MPIRPRSEWGARHRDGFHNRALPHSQVWLHHSVSGAPSTLAGERAEMRNLENIGQSRFGGGISYTFVVFPSGNVYQGHSVYRSGAHTAGRNDVASAICLAGNYEVRHMTTAQINSVAWLLRHGRDRGWWRHARLNGGHRDLKSTACPGRHAYAQIGRINQLAASPPKPGGFLMALSNAQQTELLGKIRYIFDWHTAGWKSRDPQARGAKYPMHDYILGTHPKLNRLEDRVNELYGMVKMNPNWPAKPGAINNATATTWAKVIELEKLVKAIAEKVGVDTDAK